MPKPSTSQDSKTAFVIVRSDEWEGLYINGILTVEGFSLSVVDGLAALGIRASVVSCDEDWLQREGNSLPIELGDVKF